MDLFEGVGTVARVDHVALQTVPGKLKLVVELFQRFGYVEDVTRRLHGDWGAAHFLEKEGSLPIQITDPMTLPEKAEFVPTETHVAISVEDTEKVALAIEHWADRVGHIAGIVRANDGKIFVIIVTLLTVDIELVPNS